MSAALELETFARIQARLRAPFADRDAVLHAAGVDELTFRSSKAHWQEQLAAEGAEPLRDRYRVAFASGGAPAPAPPPKEDGDDGARGEGDVPGSPPPAPPDSPQDDKKYVASYMLATPMAPPPVRLAAPPAVGPAVAPGPAPPAPVAKKHQTATLVASTEPLDFDRLRAIVMADPTPFLGRTTPERLQQLRAETAPTVPPAAGDPSAPAGRTAPGPDETAMYVPDAPVRADAGALPFTPKSEPPSFPDLTVDRYAALAAEIQAKGALPRVLARYDVSSPGALAALHAAFDRRFKADPALRARFEERRAHFLMFMQPTR